MTELHKSRQGPFLNEPHDIINVQCFLDLFGLHVNTVGTHWSYSPEDHQAFEVNYVIAGMQALTVNGEPYRMEPGDLVIINPKKLHASTTVPPQGLTYLCFHFVVDEPLFFEWLIRANKTFYPGNSPLVLRSKPFLSQLSLLYQKYGNLSLRDKFLVVSSFYHILLALIDECESVEERGFIPASPAVTHLAHLLAGVK